MRLNAFLAKAGVASRRGADELIKAGHVLVNSDVGQLNSQVHESDTVSVNGQQVKLRKSRYILLHKPAGYVTTLKDPLGRQKVIDLIKIDERIVPVGRLDYDTTGALLLTNDGQLAHRLMHPKYKKNKTYVAEVQADITGSTLNKLRHGITLEDGQAAPAKVKKLSNNLLEITIHEGRKHQVKRMLTTVGLPVKSLHRSSFAGLSLDGLKPGQWRDLSETELKLLQ